MIRRPKTGPAPASLYGHRPRPIGVEHPDFAAAYITPGLLQFKANCSTIQRAHPFDPNEHYDRTFDVHAINLHNFPKQGAVTFQGPNISIETNAVARFPVQLTLVRHSGHTSAVELKYNKRASTWELVNKEALDDVEINIGSGIIELKIGQMFSLKVIRDAELVSLPPLLTLRTFKDLYTTFEQCSDLVYFSYADFNEEHYDSSLLSDHSGSKKDEFYGDVIREHYVTPKLDGWNIKAAFDIDANMQEPGRYDRNPEYHLFTSSGYRLMRPSTAVSQLWNIVAAMFGHQGVISCELLRLNNIPRSAPSEVLDQRDDPSRGELYLINSLWKTKEEWIKIDPAQKEHIDAFVAHRVNCANFKEYTECQKFASTNRTNVDKAWNDAALYVTRLLRPNETADVTLPKLIEYKRRFDTFLQWIKMSYDKTNVMYEYATQLQALIRNHLHFDLVTPAYRLNPTLPIRQYHISRFPDRPDSNTEKAKFYKRVCEFLYSAAITPNSHGKSFEGLVLFYGAHILHQTRLAGSRRKKFVPIKWKPLLNAEATVIKYVYASQDSDLRRRVGIDLVTHLLCGWSYSDEPFVIRLTKSMHPDEAKQTYPYQSLVSFDYQEKLASGKPRFAVNPRVRNPADMSPDNDAKATPTFLYVNKFASGGKSTAAAAAALSVEPLAEKIPPAPQTFTVALPANAKAYLKHDPLKFNSRILVDDKQYKLYEQPTKFEVPSGQHLYVSSCKNVTVLDAITGDIIIQGDANGNTLTFTNASHALFESELDYKYDQGGSSFLAVDNSFDLNENLFEFQLPELQYTACAKQNGSTIPGPLTLFIRAENSKKRSFAFTVAVFPQEVSSQPSNAARRQPKRRAGTESTPMDFPVKYDGKLWLPGHFSGNFGIKRTVDGLWQSYVVIRGAKNMSPMPGYEQLKDYGRNVSWYAVTKKADDGPVAKRTKTGAAFVDLCASLAYMSSSNLK